MFRSVFNVVGWICFQTSIPSFPCCHFWSTQRRNWPGTAARQRLVQLRWLCWFRGCPARQWERMTNSFSWFRSPFSRHWAKNHQHFFVRYGLLARQHRQNPVQHLIRPYRFKLIAVLRHEFHCYVGLSTRNMVVSNLTDCQWLLWFVGCIDDDLDLWIWASTLNGQIAGRWALTSRNPPVEGLLGRRLGWGRRS